MNETKVRATPLVYYLLIIAVTFIVYEEVRLNGFVWDTVPMVLQNPWLSHPDAADFVAMFTQYYRANWQPMVWLSHALDFAVFDHNAALNHFSNVAYHAIDACLVWRFTTLLIEEAPLSKRQQELVALIAALIFAIHPQHVQSVAWLVERKDTLYVLFTLLCFISYIRGYKSGVRGIRSYVPWAFLVLALMSKPMAVTVPAVLVLLDIFPLRRWQGDFAALARLALEKWAYWLVSAGVILITLYTQQRAMVSLEHLPLWARPATALNNSLFYVFRFLVPLNLSPIYPYSSSAATISALSYWLPGAIFLTTTIGGGLWLFVRGIRWPLPMMLFYVITLLPVCGLVAVGPSKALDYYSYLATLPFAVLIAFVMVKSYEVAGRGRTIVAGVAAFYLIALAVLSFQQVRVWRNELTVWVRANELYPDSGYINRNLSSTYLLIGEYDLALKYGRLSAQENAMNKQYAEDLQRIVRQRQGK